MSAATGYYRPGQSWLHRRSPITKLLGLGLVVVASFLLPPLILPALVGTVLMAAASARLARPLLRGMRIPAVLLASIVGINALFFPGPAESLVNIGPLAVTREGLTFGLTSAGRLLTVFLASVLFLFSTLADDLVEALVARGASHRIAFVVLSAVQLVPRLQERAGSILDAQQARGLRVGGSLGHRVRALVPLVGPLLLGALIDVRERTFALEARGFGAGAERTAYREIADPPSDRLLRALISAGIVLVVLGTVTGIIR